VLDTDVMEVGSLEEMLEGGTRPLAERRPIEPIRLEPVTSTRKVRSPGSWRAPIVVVLLVLGGAAAWLLSMLLRGHGLGGP